MHYYQFNIGDYTSHTAHLSEMEDLAYFRMLNYCYLKEIGLPKSLEEIGRLIRMRSHCDCIKSVLREFFTLDGDVYKHRRVDKEIDSYKSKSKKASESANARWAKTKDSDDANALRTDCEGNANHKPRTINHKPRTKNQSVTANAGNKTKLSDDFILDDHKSLLATKYWTWKNRTDLIPLTQDIFDEFTNDSKAKGKTFVDWNAAWKGWYSNAIRFRSPQNVQDNRFNKTNIADEALYAKYPHLRP